ncbi:uncharacterized protein LOC132752424 [Ruditapes philippinarum]|uniref:uncharacterized protein LOC132752424 n=1 Tax=Ruditapes philippinarum TaxID=129788 RepID=UPI00295B058A|nr:uncharacterized protein LOC132752424 [Ruditapes philippinarum]
MSTMIYLLGLAAFLLGTVRAENIKCSTSCMTGPDNTTDTCNTTTGHCLYGCTTSPVGQNCTVECSSGCELSSQNDIELCNSSTRECFNGCKPYFVGPTCSSKCPDMCNISTDPKAEICNISTGECLFGCLYGYAGPNCTITCPDKCGISEELYTQTCNATTDECLFGCLQGFGGPDCKTNCSSTCKRPASKDTETCDITETCAFGCTAGYAGHNCSFECPVNCSTPENSTETCNSSTGECLHGCQDGFAGLNCTIECPQNCFSFNYETCNYTSGECLHGCQKGFAGQNCSHECPVNCTHPTMDGGETCNYTDGTCIHGCNKGLTGPDCSHPCPENCKLPDRDGEETCNFTSGECHLGCNNGYTGPNCSFECPRNCLFPSENETGTCNLTSGECFNGCNFGYAGSNCSVKCPENCTKNNRGEDICNATTEECLFGCDDGLYGPKCAQECSNVDVNCEKCIGTNDNAIVCKRCSLNFYLSPAKCLSCGYWCISVPGVPVCRQEDGHCNHGCKPGRFGSMCDRRCSNTCKDVCDRDTGTCSDCNYATYCGPTCEISCQDGCLHRLCNQSCQCMQGCTATKWGEKCLTVCNKNCNKPSDPLERVCNASDGTCHLGCDGDHFWGNQCSKQCSNNCVNVTCEQDSGKCTDGCTINTVYGWRCDTKCNKNCLDGTCKREDGYCDNGCKGGTYGVKCEKTCGINCINSTCTRETGICDVGCKDGSYGDHCGTKCSGTCLNKRCERNSGNCTDGCISGYGGYHCKTVLGITQPPPTTVLGNNWIYVAIGCGALVLLGFMVTIVLITKKRRQIAKRRRTARMSTIPDEKVIEESQRRHKHKTEGAGARLTQLFVENPLARFMKYRSQHGGDLITKTPITGILKRVINMGENDMFNHEFDKLKTELTKSHEASRRLDNLALNLYNGIYPYDENRVVLKRSSFEEEVTKRKSKGLRGILKSVRFSTFANSNYEVMKADSNDTKDKQQSRRNKGKDGSNGYTSVVFNVNDETAEMKPSKSKDEVDNDDYATVNIQGNNKQTTDLDDEPHDYAKVSLGATAVNTDDIQVDETYDHTRTFGQDGTAGTSSDYAVVDKGKFEQADNTTKDEIDKIDDEQCDYAVVHKNTSRSEDVTKRDKGVGVTTAKDYINASLIKGYNQNEKYIAAQGPSKLTVNDFWIMAWEQKSSFIIMLLEITEEGRTRCEKYWPEHGKDETYGDITVTCYDSKQYADYIIRFLRLCSNNGHEREIVHLQYTAWPEEGCPVSAIEFIQFHQKYRSLTKGRLGTGPTIVHCTAGVGRTGVFIALDMLVEEGLDSLNVDVFKCVTTLREQRVLMVHSIDQYEFLYKVVAQTFALEVQPCHKLRLQDKLTELKKFDHDSGKTKLELLHQNLKDSLRLDTVEIGSVDVMQERRNKDRPTSDVPDVLFRPDLPNNIYINAVIYDSLTKKETIVAAQMPTPDTLQDFCQLIVYHKCATVIMLNHFDPNDKSLGIYWPTGKTPVVAGKLIVSQLDVEKEADYIVRQLRIHTPETGDDSAANEVTMIQYKSWKVVKNVPNAKNMMKFLKLCQRHIKGSPDKATLVHCLNGAEQSGLFCALLNLYEFVDTEDEISVPSVVRRILARRPNAISATDQFEMCFAATCEYIKKP